MRASASRPSLRFNMPALASTAMPVGLLMRRWPERRAVLLSVAALLLVLVFGAMWLANDPALGLAFLAVVPIVIAALELGQRGGLAAGALAVAAVSVEAALGHPRLGAVAIGTHALVFVAVGAAAGRFSDRMRAAYNREERLLRSGLRLSEVSVPERMGEVVSREVLATPGVIAAAVTFEDVTPAPGDLGDARRTRLPMLAHGVRVGAIEAVHEKPLAPEDRAALGLLARQSALASENLRLLAVDGERAALESRLRELRQELLETRSGAGLLLEAEEDEKRRLAVKLHEDLAQVLSAVLLGMRLLERRSPADRSASLQQLHDQVSEVLSEVRDVARTLRPVVLDQLGLRAAIEALASAAEDGGVTVALYVRELPPAIPASVEAAVYRIVEDALAWESGDRVGVTLEQVRDGLQLRIGVAALPSDALLALRTRAEAAGGRVVSGSAELRVRFSTAGVEDDR
jgi:signal transduction histidine kinase